MFTILVEKADLWLLATVSEKFPYGQLTSDIQSSQLESVCYFLHFYTLFVSLYIFLNFGPSKEIKSISRQVQK